MSKTSPPPAPGTPEPPPGDRLDSWKEIAVYLKREVRTAQRWEKNEGLPVRRHQHDKLSTVFAYKSELDAWWHERQPQLEKEVETPDGEDTPDSSFKIPSTRKDEPAADASAMLAANPLRRALALVVLLFVILGVFYLYKRFLLGSQPISTRTRLVVLPFRNLSSDPAQDVFCQGLTQAMTTQLGRLDPEHLGIIAATTADKIKDKPVDEIGSELGVNYVLEGSVSRSANQVRIDAQLILVSDQTLKRAITFSRDVGDMLSLQNEVAQAIASDIRLTLSPAEKERLEAGGKVDPEAYEAYLQGLVAWNKRTPQGLAKSIEYFNTAIEKSPKYAAAYAGLADAYSILSAVPTAAMSPLVAMPKAKKAAEEAIGIDPSSAEAHAALALVRQSYDWDWDGAEQEFQRAFAINPSYGSARQWHSLLLMARGRNSEALEEIERARTLDPLSPVIPASRIQAFYFSRQYDRAIEECRKAIEVEPNFLTVHYHLGQSLLAKGKFAEAIAELKKAEALADGPTPVFTMALGHAYGVSGDRATALKSLAELNAMGAKGYVPALFVSAIYTGMGDRDRAMQWLQKAYDERTEYMIFLNVEPMADPLRSDPRFQALLRKVGLP
jgi:TolB-like protein/Tfp pilus assembly protein PilF